MRWSDTVAVRVAGAVALVCAFDRGPGRSRLEGPRVELALERVGCSRRGTSGHVILRWLFGLELGVLISLGMYLEFVGQHSWMMHRVWAADTAGLFGACIRIRCTQLWTGVCVYAPYGPSPHNCTYLLLPRSCPSTRTAAVTSEQLLDGAIHVLELPRGAFQCLPIPTQVSRCALAVSNCRKLLSSGA